MNGMFETQSGAYLSLAGLERVSKVARSGLATATFTGGHSTDIDHWQIAKLTLRPTHFIAPEPGTFLVWLADGGAPAAQRIRRSRVVGWAFCQLGDLRPVTAVGVLDDDTADGVFVEFADGVIQDLRRHEGIVAYESREEWLIQLETEELARERLAQSDRTEELSS